MRRRSFLCVLAVFAFVCTAPVPAEETTEFRFYDEQGTLLTNVNVAFDTGAVSSKMAPQSNGVYTVPVGPGGKVSFQVSGPDASYGSTAVAVPVDLSGPMDIVLQTSGAGNSDCNQAEMINVGETVSGDTSVDGGPQTAPFCGTSISADGVWFKTSGTGETLTASTCNQADYDTKISIYCADCEDFTCVDSDSTGCAAFNSEAVWCSEVGADRTVSLVAMITSPTHVNRIGRMVIAFMTAPRRQHDGFGISDLGLRIPC